MQFSAELEKELLISVNDRHTTSRPDWTWLQEKSKEFPSIPGVSGNNDGSENWIGFVCCKVTAVVELNGIKGEVLEIGS